jgi:hypothetical protein
MMVFLSPFLCLEVVPERLLLTTPLFVFGLSSHDKDLKTYCITPEPDMEQYLRIAWFPGGVPSDMIHFALPVF